uniref:Uncharacterized protein n=1 Tax=Anguilla anguilla TaxID=7936 RepID=A0A0E9TEF6_ANGAN
MLRFLSCHLFEGPVNTTLWKQPRFCSEEKKLHPPLLSLES